MTIAARLAALERWRRPDPDPIVLRVIDDRRGHDPRTARYAVPGVDGILERDSYAEWEAEQSQQAHAAGRQLRIYISQRCDG